MIWKKIETSVFAYAENLMSMFRTAGALLVGNSVLVHYKVIGISTNALDVATYGVIFGLLGSLPVTAIYNLFKKG